MNRCDLQQYADSPTPTCLCGASSEGWLYSAGTYADFAISIRAGNPWLRQVPEQGLGIPAQADDGVNLIGLVVCSLLSRTMTLNDHKSAPHPSPLWMAGTANSSWAL